MTMAKIKSAAKRARTSEIVGQRNASVKAGFRTLVRNFNELLDHDPAEAAKFFEVVATALDQAAGKKVIHANTAARKKSRLAQRLKMKLAGGV
jgi:small subunit ribosomal protein S20